MHVLDVSYYRLILCFQEISAQFYDNNFPVITNQLRPTNLHRGNITVLVLGLSYFCICIMLQI